MSKIFIYVFISLAPLIITLSWTRSSIVIMGTFSFILDPIYDACGISLDPTEKIIPLVREPHSLLPFDPVEKHCNRLGSWLKDIKYFTRYICVSNGVMKLGEFCCKHILDPWLHKNGKDSGSYIVPGSKTWVVDLVLWRTFACSVVWRRVTTSDVIPGGFTTKD